MRTGNCRRATTDLTDRRGSAQQMWRGRVDEVDQGLTQRMRPFRAQLAGMSGRPGTAGLVRGRMKRHRPRVSSPSIGVIAGISEKNLVFT